MKTKIMKLSLLVGIALSLGSLFSSCDEQIKPDAPDTDEAGNVFTTTETVIPLRYTESEYKGGETGVSIKVTKATADELVFTCKPGLDIQSYLIQAYPMSFIYDVLMDNMVGEGKEKYTLTEVNDLLMTLIANMADNNTTARGRLVSEITESDNFYELEIDYMDTENRVFQIQPDMDYLIVAFSSFSANEDVVAGGEAPFQDPADLCICHVRTEAREIDGNPSVDLNVETGISSFRVTYIPNDDCGYFHYLTAPKTSIDRYVNAFGDDMYCQLLCNIAGRVENGDADNSTYTNNSATNQEYTTTVVALDRNGTSVREYNSKDFKLKDMPENAEKAECEIFDPHKIGGSIVEFKVHMNANCKDVRYGIYLKSTVDEIMKYSDEDKEAYAKAMCDPTEASPVWGISNFNYSYDLNNEEDPLHGSLPMDVSDYQWELKGETTYRIIYAGYDRFNNPGELKATGAFTTKQLSRYTPEDCKSDLVMTVKDESRTSLTLHFEYDKENTALYYFQYYSPIPEGAEGAYVFPENDNPGANREKWMYMFLDFKNPDPMATPWPNMTRDEGEGKISTDLPWSGFTPGTEYKFAYMAEDWDGNYGYVKFETASTLSVSGGDNPTVTTEAVLKADGSYEVTYTANTDTREIRYMVVNETSPQYDNLAIEKLLACEGRKEQFMSVWRTALIGSDGGLKTSELKAIQTGPLEGPVTIALAVAIGGKTDPVYSPISAVIIRDEDKDGTVEQEDIMTIDEYFTKYYPETSSSKVSTTVTLDITPGVHTHFVVRPDGSSVKVRAL